MWNCLAPIWGYSADVVAGEPANFAWMDNIMILLQAYGTAQRQIDFRMCVEGWILLGEDYIMCSIFQQVPIMFVLASGKLSGLCTCKRSTHFE